MSDPTEYKGNLILKSDLNWQEVYSSQNYGTFYSIYMKFDAREDDDNAQVVTLSNIRFSIINYKGVLNIGIDNVTVKEDPDNGVIVFMVDVRALESTREMALYDDDNNMRDVVVDRDVINNIVISRQLQRMRQNFFDPSKNPNDESNLVFDDEFYYRDGLEFDQDKNDRKEWGGMDGTTQGASGKRCYETVLNPGG